MKANGKMNFTTTTRSFCVLIPFIDGEKGRGTLLCICTIFHHTHPPAAHPLFLRHARAPAFREPPIERQHFIGDAGRPPRQRLVQVPRRQARGVLGVLLDCRQRRLAAQRHHFGPGESLGPPASGVGEGSIESAECNPYNPPPIHNATHVATVSKSTSEWTGTPRRAMATISRREGRSGGGT